MALKTGVMMLKIQLCITDVNYILKYIQIDDNITVFTVFSNQINAAFLSIKLKIYETSL